MLKNVTVVDSEKQITDTAGGKNQNVYLFFEPWCISVEALWWVSGSSSINLFVFPWEYPRGIIIDLNDELLLCFKILTLMEFTLDIK